MSIDALILFVGACVAVFPFLGFPFDWYKPILFILGIFVVGLGIVVRRRGLKSASMPVAKTTPSESRGFVEHMPSEENESQADE